MPVKNATGTFMKLDEAVLSCRDKHSNESDLITLDATLMHALQTRKDRVFILEIEAMLISFIQNQRYQ